MKSNRQIGIWLDKRKAVMMEAKSDITVVFSTVESNVEEFHPVGGARSKVVWGPMDSVSEGKYLAREKLQMKRYFQKIVQTIPNDSIVYIFGPAETKIGLKKFIDEFKAKTIELVKIGNADSMTENQMIAKVTTLFKDA
jgi:hypothetical protein